MTEKEGGGAMFASPGRDRSMSEGIAWLFEGLEPRCLMSAGHHVSGKTLAARRAAPAPSQVSKSVSPSVKRQHHAPAPASTFEVAGGLAGQWSGGQNSLNNSFSGSVSLRISEGSAGYYAVLQFDRPGGERVSVQSPFMLRADGQFSLQVLTAKMMVKFTGTIYNHGTRTSSLPTMNGGFQYWDRQGTYKGAFALAAQRELPLD
jgi:hypothetical protein